MELTVVTFVKKGSEFDRFYFSPIPVDYNVPRLCQTATQDSYSAIMWPVFRTDLMAPTKSVTSQVKQK